MAGYEVVGRVASTRSGAVWKARDVALDRFVALKQVEPDGVEREAAALAALASEHIVEIYGVVHDGGDTYLAEQWVDGAPLSVVARTAGTMSPQQALGVVRGVLRGLVVTHAAGLVHGDVSLGNVLVAVDGHATLIDFGSVVRAGAAAGPSTGAFAAPEVRAGGAVSPASDVWSVAAVLVTLLQGTVSAAITTRGVDAGLRPVLDRALADAPTARYPDAAAFLAALEGAAERRYGTAWWTQAGLGALAAAGTAELLTPGEGAPFRGRPEALLGAAVIGAATPDPPVARPVADPVPPVDPPAPPARAASRRRLLVGAGAVVAILGAGAAVAVAVSGGDDKPTAEPTLDATTTSTTATPTTPPVSTTSSTPSSAAPSTVPPEQAFSGRFRVHQVVISTTGLLPTVADSRVGSVTDRQWRVITDCSGGAACRATVFITGGGSIPKVVLRRTATGWQGSAHFVDQCVSQTDGAVIGDVRRTIVYAVVAPPGSTLPKQFTGTQDDTGPAIPRCPAVHVVKRVVITRVG